MLGVSSSFLFLVQIDSANFPISLLLPPRYWSFKIVTSLRSELRPGLDENVDKDTTCGLGQGHRNKLHITAQAVWAHFWLWRHFEAKHSPPPYSAMNTVLGLLHQHKCNTQLKYVSVDGLLCSGYGYGGYVNPAGFGPPLGTDFYSIVIRRSTILTSNLNFFC